MECCSIFVMRESHGMASSDANSPFQFVHTDASISERDSRRAIRSWVTKAQHRRRRQALGQEETKNHPSPINLSSASQPTNTAASTASTESKPTTPTGDWKFLSVSNPSKEPDKAAHREVRAHVTRLQHRQRRETRDRRLQHREDAAITSTFEPSDQELPLSRTQPESAASRIEPFSEPIGAPTPNVPDSTLQYALTDPTDQLDIYARQLETNVPTIWAYYLWQEREHGHLFHSQYNGFRGSGPKYLHPLILNNQAILASTVLFTGCLLRQRAGKAVFNPAIIQLQSDAYNLVQLAVDSAEDQLSDATILAVIKMALFEAVFGHREAYRTHMRGLVRMVSLRNGLSQLGMEGYLAHLLIWFDANLSTVTNSPRYLASIVSDEEDITIAKADGDSFTLGIEPSETSDGLQ